MIRPLIVAAFRRYPQNLHRHPHLQRRGDPPRRGRRPARAARALRLELRDHPGRERLEGPHGGHRRGARRPSTPRFASSRIGEPNYGKALKKGILESRGEFVICDEIDLCDADFHRRAIALLESREVDMVIGSKLIAGAEDDRPGRATQRASLHQPAAGHSRLPRHRHPRSQGVSAPRAHRHRRRLSGRQRRLRERVRHPRLSRQGSASTKSRCAWSRSVLLRSTS